MQALAFFTVVTALAFPYAIAWVFLNAAPRKRAITPPSLHAPKMDSPLAATRQAD
jgi:hypothetical protein